MPLYQFVSLLEKTIKKYATHLIHYHMKKYKKTLHIHDFQQKLDFKYGKGKFHAVLVLSLFFCLSFTSCSNDLHNSGTTNRSNIGGSIEGTTHEGQSSGARIQITNTGQTVTLNKSPYGDNPTVLDAYFAQQDTKSKMKKTVLLILVLFLLSPLQKE